MKGSDIETSDPSAVVSAKQDFGTAKHVGQFIPARDYRNRRVPGLYLRNGRFYAVLWTDRGDGRKGARRFPLYDADLQPIRTLAQAKDALMALRQSDRQQELPIGGLKPEFDQFALEYLNLASTRAKQPRTQEKEKAALGTLASTP